MFAEAQHGGTPLVAAPGGPWSSRMTSGQIYVGGPCVALVNHPGNQSIVRVIF